MATVEPFLRDLPELLRDPDRRRAALVRRHRGRRRGRRGRDGREGRRDERRRRPGRRRHEREHRPRRVHRSDPRRHRDGEGRHRQAGLDARARRRSIRSCATSSRRAIRRASSSEATTSASRDNVLAHGGRLLDLYTPYADYYDLFLSLHGAHQADNAAAAITAVECFLDGPLPADVVADVFASVRSPGPARGRRTPPARAPRRRAQRRRRAGVARRARRGVPGVRSGLSSSGCSARRSRTRCWRRWARPTRSC